MPRRHRSSGCAFLLFHENTTLGWRVLRRISAADGEKRVMEHTARRVHNELGQMIGYQFCSAGVLPVPSERTSVVISRGEMERVAGAAFTGGKSRTAGMPECKRLERMQQVHPVSGKRLTAEDAVERAEEKVKAYPTLVGEMAWRADVRARVAKARA